MCPKLTTKAKLRRQKIVNRAIMLYQNDPDIGLKEIGKRVKKSHQWVSLVLKEYRAGK